jgi:rhodanese-related sulfurtransferase
LFVGDIARPDLAIEKEEGARLIFRSLHERLMALPDTCEVWPGHLGGSLCGGPGMDMKPSSTIGFERARAELLAVADEDEFVRRALAALRPQPPNFENIVALNRGPLVVESAEVHPLTPRQVDQARADGALVVDVRTALQFDEAHIPDSVSITALRAGFGSKLAWVVEPGQRVVLVGRDDEDARRAAALAEAVGITRLDGFLAGGMTSWREERRPVERIERIAVPELRERDAQILDVREQDEWDAAHIPGSTHAPYHGIHDLPEGIDREQPVAVICSSGQRAAVAASLLRRYGARDVLHVVDGGVRDYLN